MPSVRTSPEPLFERGMLVMTRGISSLIEMGKLNPLPFIQRHLNGDWGDLSEEDCRTNEAALTHGEQLVSSYQVNPHLKIDIITESDRSATT